MLEVNEYYAGKVKSIGFQTRSLPATVGVMEAGEYEFSASRHETMKVISGAMRIQLAGSDEWHSYHAGETFEVPAGQTFRARITAATAYFCTYG